MPGRGTPPASWRGLSPGVGGEFAPRRQLAMSGDIFIVTTCWEVLLASHGEGPGMLLNSFQPTGSPVGRVGVWGVTQPH